MGAYGCSWVATPGFDRVAREGLLCTRAYTSNAKCAPSRSSILTGRNSWQLEEAANHWPAFPAKFKTFAEALSEQRYFVGSTGKGWAPGIPGQIDGKPRQLAGKPFSQRKTQPPARGISNNDYAANFEDFLEARPEGTPFCFWYGGYEPHRGYEYGAGLAKGGKALTDVDRVFSFWPDNETVRTDMLDYAFEIEYFDLHLQRMLKTLEDRKELDNTVVIVTADNGMPFPRVKGQEYELSNHLPLAIMWKNGINKPGRVIDDFISFIDFAPTFLDLAGVTQTQCAMQPVQGRSLRPLFESRRSGVVDRTRDHVVFGKERHDVGRPHDWGYPIRGIVKGQYLYVRNFEPTRWPAGDPETGYLNCDGSPTKTQVLQMRRTGETSEYWKAAFGKRPEEELYQIDRDPDCMVNLADEPEHARVKARLSRQLISELKAQEDPRMFGQGKIFDDYPYMDKNTADFYDRTMRGEKLKAGWVNPTDFEPAEK
jgi:arylsulfatase A-like enzyme